MHIIMRGFLAIIGFGLFLTALTFLPPVQNFCDDKAYEYVLEDKFKRAKSLYFIGTLQGNQKATNNYHVINYRLTRYGEKATKKQRQANYKKTLRALDKLAQDGFTPALYNAGMFYYGAKTESARYTSGLKYFDAAAASGDKMSAHAAEMMRARKFQKDKKYQAYRKSADNGNGWAAYRYANQLRFDKKKLRGAEKYALMGAEAGYADAQQFLASYFPHRRDAKDWLEKAATNRPLRSLIAANNLADIAQDERDYVTRRRWLSLAVAPREKFIYQSVIAPEGLRWRGLQHMILADVGTSAKAAYELALMQIDGVGGPVEKDNAMKNLLYAGDWSDAAILLAELKSGNSSSSITAREQKPSVKQKSPSKQNSKRNVDEGLKSFDEHLKRFDAQKNYPFYEKLRPFVKKKHIRYATRTDVKKFASGVSRVYSNKSRGFTPRGEVQDCNVGYSCFYMEKPITLPKGMAGGFSATFIINPAIIMPEQHTGHNKYIFLNDRFIP